MADEQKSGVWESIRLWLTAVGIPIVLAVAGFWQFYLKEVWWPAAAINLSTEVSLKEAGISDQPDGEAKNLEAIELVITARNPSSSTVYLCSNYWAAFGVTIGGPKEEKNKSWVEDLTNTINSDAQIVHGRHFTPKESVLVAGGQAFRDSVLRPNEKITVTYIFYIPQGRYDHLEVLTEVPTTSRESPAQGLMPAIKTNYEWNADGYFKMASIARMMPNGSQVQIPFDAAGQLPEREKRYYGLQEESSVAGLSLWQKRPSAQNGAERAEASALRAR